jgi:hypothetical protein
MVTVSLLRPDTTNWGYDVVISGMAAVNPVLLESGRPDELVDLAAVAAQFPVESRRSSSSMWSSAIRTIRAWMRSTGHYFAGPNMYGQNLDYQNPPCARSFWRCSAAR